MVKLVVLVNPPGAPIYAESHADLTVQWRMALAYLAIGCASSMQPSIAEKPLTIAVTGASGFIGSHVVDALLSRGHTVRATVRDTADTAKTAHLTGVHVLSHTHTCTHTHTHTPQHPNAHTHTLCLCIQNADQA